MFRLLRFVLRPQVLYTKLVLMRRPVFTYPGRSNYRFVQIITLSASPSSFVYKTCFNEVSGFLFILGEAIIYLFRYYAQCFAFQFCIQNLFLWDGRFLFILGEAIIDLFRLLRFVLRPQVLYAKLVLTRRSVFCYPGRSNYRFVQTITPSASSSSFVHKTCFNGMDDFYLSGTHTRPIIRLSMRQNVPNKMNNTSCTNRAFRSIRGAHTRPITGLSIR